MALGYQDCRNRVSAGLAGAVRADPPAERGQARRPGAARLAPAVGEPRRERGGIVTPSDAKRGSAVPRPVIMFDHDGVLVDSLTIFTAAFGGACGAHGHPEIASEEQVVALFADNVYDTMAAMGMSRETIAAIIGDTAATLSLSADLHPFPGVPELLSGLAEHFDVVVVTSNAAGVVRDFMAREQLADSVSDVLGVEVDVSKVRKIATIMARYPDQDALLLRGRHLRRHDRGRPGRRHAARRRLGLARRGGAARRRRRLCGDHPGRTARLRDRRGARPALLTPRAARAPAWPEAALPYRVRAPDWRPQACAASTRAPTTRYDSPSGPATTWRCAAGSTSA